MLALYWYLVDASFRLNKLYLAPRLLDDLPDAHSCFRHLITGQKDTGHLEQDSLLAVKKDFVSLVASAKVACALHNYLVFWLNLQHLGSHSGDNVGANANRFVTTTTTQQVLCISR